MLMATVSSSTTVGAPYHYPTSSLMLTVHVACSSNGCSNPQCWMDGGIGYADASYVLGPAGDDAYRKHRQQAVDAWAADSGCSAGGNA